MNKLTDKEKGFIISVLSNLNINPLQDNAVEIINTVQSIVVKLQPVDEKAEKEKG